MLKKRIYLDTSVISYLRQEDVPIQMAETRQFWEILKDGKYDVFVSDVTVTELSNCSEPKRTELLALLEDVKYNLVTILDNHEITAIASEIENLKILPAKNIFDRLHITSAIYSGCNVIVSWNFEHMVNVKTIDGVRIVCLANNTNPIDIFTPQFLLERSDSNE